MVRRIWMAALATVIASSALIQTGIDQTAGAAIVDDRPTLLGLATNDFRTNIPDFAAEAGRGPAFYQTFWSLEMSPGAWLNAELEQLSTWGVVPYVELTTNDFSAFLRGERDAELDEIIGIVETWLGADSGRAILMAPFPEANLDSHSWGGDPAGYRQAYLKVRQAFLDTGLAGDQVRFVFAMNGLSSTGLSYAPFYPGDDVVDVLGFSKLNRGNRDYEITFVMHIRQMQAEISRSKPILVTQTATVDDGAGGRAAWLTDMFGGLLQEEQVIGAIYFNKNKDHDYRVLINGELEPAFRTGYQGWSDPSESSWIFDGRMDAWVANREALFGRFIDIAGSSFFEEILWIADQGITQGCAPDRYCPADPVSRGQMASFLARALTLPSGSTDYFRDDNGSVHESNINRIREADVTLGCGVDVFCPGSLVTRAQMASFLARALSLPATSTDFFSDDDGSTHETNINRVAAAGITLGCRTNNYCPMEPVTRGQMAAFLFRAFGS